MIHETELGFWLRTSADPEKKTQKLNAELANGRLAMTLGYKEIRSQTAVSISSELKY